MEIWKKQKEQGKALTVTDLNAVRYMSSADKVAETIIKLIPVAENGLYILNMPKYTVLDLIKKHFGDCKLENIGLRPGEKLVEELVKSNEKCIIIDMEEDLCPL
jgi:UDP-N-acetylglucosamine 4,6-dehydratase